jgi:hypothetical protein
MFFEQNRDKKTFEKTFHTNLTEIGTKCFNRKNKEKHKIKFKRNFLNKTITKKFCRKLFKQTF